MILHRGVLCCSTPKDISDTMGSYKALGHTMCAAQGLTTEEVKKLQALREQVAAASREADTSHAKAMQTHRQLAMLRQAVHAAQQSMHSTQPRPSLSKAAHHCQGSFQAPTDDPPQQMTPTCRPFSIWHEDRKGPSSDDSPGRVAMGVVDDRTYQQCCTEPPERFSSHASSPIRLTAGHWQRQPNSGSTDVARMAEHAQRAGDSMHNQEPTLSALQARLCSAEAEVARLRTQLQTQHAASDMDVAQHYQPISGQPATPNNMGNCRREDAVTGRWAQVRARDPFVEKTVHRDLTGQAGTSGSCAELASVSAKVR